MTIGRSGCDTHGTSPNGSACASDNLRSVLDRSINPPADAQVPDLWNALNKQQATIDSGLDRQVLDAVQAVAGNADGVPRNLVITANGPRATAEPTTWATRRIADLELTPAGQTFARYWYDEKNPTHDNITAYGRDTFRAAYPVLASEPDDDLGWWIMMYVYGLLSDPGYQERYRHELRRTMPRIPLVPQFERIAAVGGRLLVLHACWAEHRPPRVVGIADHDGAPMLDASFRDGDACVRKVKWADKAQKHLISLTPDVTLAGVTSDTHRHRMNGYSALELFVQNTAPKMVRAYDRDCPAENTVERWHKRINRVVWVLNETARLLKLLPEIDYDSAARTAKSTPLSPPAL